MPLAIVLAVMLSILSGFYLSENHVYATQQQQTSQSDALAGNMVGLRDYVFATAQAPAPDGTMPNYASFMAFTGLATDYINSVPPNQRAQTMSWYKPMPGVNGWITGGTITVYYVPTTQQGEDAPAGVQTALIQISGDEMNVGHAVP